MHLDIFHQPEYTFHRLEYTFHAVERRMELTVYKKQAC